MGQKEQSLPPSLQSLPQSPYPQGLTPRSPARFAHFSHPHHQLLLWAGCVLSDYTTCEDGDTHGSEDALYSKLEYFGPSGFQLRARRQEKVPGPLLPARIGHHQLLTLLCALERPEGLQA